MPRSPRSEAAARFSAFQPREKDEEKAGAAVAVTGGSALIGALLGTLSGVGPIEGAKAGVAVGGPLAALIAGGKSQEALATGQLISGGLSGISRLRQMFREQQQAGGFQPSTPEEAALLKDLK